LVSATGKAAYSSVLRSVPAELHAAELRFRAWWISATTMLSDDLSTLSTRAAMELCLVNSSREANLEATPDVHDVRRLEPHGRREALEGQGTCLVGECNFTFIRSPLSRCRPNSRMTGGRASAIWSPRTSVVTMSMPTVTFWRGRLVFGRWRPGREDLLALVCGVPA